MTVQDLFAGPSEVQPRRVEHGKYGWYKLSALPPLPDGTKLKDAPRVSTLKSTIADMFKLQQWEKSQVVIGFALDPKVREAMEALDFDQDRKALEADALELAEMAKEAAGANKGADHGTRMHSVLEHLDIHGIVPGDSTPTEARFALAYSKALADKGLEVVPAFTERVIYNSALHVAGRMDRGLTDGTSLIVGDIKTQKYKPGDYDYIATSVQFACYANADWTFNEQTWEWEPMPADMRTDTGVVFWMPAGVPKCETLRVPLDDGWTFALASQRVREWRKIKGFMAL